MKLLHFGKVKEGKFTLNNPVQFNREIKAFEGKEVVITLEKKSKKRSTQQNRYYHGVVLPILRNGLNDHGWTIEGRRLDETDVHEMLKNSFLKGEIVNENTGETIPTKRSTTKLTTTDFNAFIEDVQRWAAEKDIFIPDPVNYIDAQAA